MIDWLIDWLINQLIDDQSIDWLIDRSTSVLQIYERDWWLIYQLIDRSIDRLSINRLMINCYILCAGVFASILPDYQKIEIMMFIMGKVPLPNRKSIREEEEETREVLEMNEWVLPMQPEDLVKCAVLYGKRLRGRVFCGVLGVPQVVKILLVFPQPTTVPTFWPEPVPPTVFVPEYFKNFTSFFSQFWLLFSSKLHQKALFYSA